MRLEVHFTELLQSFSPKFGEVINISDGGYERGYAAGVEFSQTELVGIVEKTIANVSNSHVTTVGNYVFAENGRLLTVDLPNVITVQNYAFQSSTNLHNVNLPKVKSIGTRAFVNTSSLQRLDLPACVSIGNACFHGSSKIRTLILRSETVCSLGSADVFGSGPIPSGTGFVYVPDNLVEQYKSTANWSNYASQIKPLSELDS